MKDKPTDNTNIMVQMSHKKNAKVLKYANVTLPVEVADNNAEKEESQ